MKASAACLIASMLLAAEFASAEGEGGSFAVTGAHVFGHGERTLVVRNGLIEAITEAPADDSLPVVDGTGRFIVPGFIDSHVHLSFGIGGPELARGGIVAAVDLAAPEAFLSADLTPLQVLLAGPMLTAVTGYPTRSWGSEGYGLEIRGTDAAKKAVDRLHAAGARVIKLPIGDATGDGAIPIPRNPSRMTDGELTAVVERAHSHGMRVGAHALNEIDVRRAAIAGVDVLVHTPTERLSDETLSMWSERAVISTLAAFTDLTEPAENVRRLRAAGATVLYGTDLGYTRYPGINPRELELLGKAGLDARAIIAAATTLPAAFWGFDPGLVSLAVGSPANFSIVSADPERDPLTMARPLSVYINGRSP